MEDPNVKAHHYVLLRASHMPSEQTLTLRFRHEDETEHALIVEHGRHKAAPGCWVERWPGGRKMIERAVQQAFDEIPQAELVQVVYDHPDATPVYGRRR